MGKKAAASDNKHIKTTSRFHPACFCHIVFRDRMPIKSGRKNGLWNMGIRGQEK